jgi:hypothetical protein
MIVLATLSLISTLKFLSNPKFGELVALTHIPVPVQILLMFAEIFMLFISGVAMLQGHDWGRLLCVAGTILIEVHVLILPRNSHLTQGALALVLIYLFLYLPKANCFFSASPTKKEKPNSDVASFDL